MRCILFLCTDLDDNDNDYEQDAEEENDDDIDEEVDEEEGKLHNSIVVR